MWCQLVFTTLLLGRLGRIDYLISWFPNPWCRCPPTQYQNAVCVQLDLTTTLVSTNTTPVIGSLRAVSLCTTHNDLLWIALALFFFPRLAAANYVVFIPCSFCWWHWVEFNLKIVYLKKTIMQMLPFLECWVYSPYTHFHERIQNTQHTLLIFVICDIYSRCTKKKTE